MYYADAFSSGIQKLKMYLRVQKFHWRLTIVVQGYRPDCPSYRLFTIISASSFFLVLLLFETAVTEIQICSRDNKSRS